MIFTKKLLKHGTSLGINIDRVIKNSLDLKQGDEVEFMIRKKQKK